MRKLLILCASATILGAAALSATEALAHGGGGGHAPMMGGPGGGNHEPVINMGGSKNGMGHNGFQNAGFSKDGHKKGYRRGDHSEAPDFGDESDDGDDDGCSAVWYQGRRLWACE